MMMMPMTIPMTMLSLARTMLSLARRSSDADGASAANADGASGTDDDDVADGASDTDNDDGADGGGGVGSINNTPFRPTPGLDTVGQNQLITIQTITAMPEYERYSLEELC